MKYGDFIEVNENFQSSINLEYDLNSIEKVRNYIPTEQSVEILGDLLQSFYYSNESSKRASILIGPYGRGKSHLLLVLVALTSMDLFKSEGYSLKEARAVQKELCKKIESVNPKIGALASTIVKDQIRTLPIIINSNSTDINQAFLMALNVALEKAGLKNLLPETYFDSAVEILKKWETDFPDVIKIICGELKKEKTTLEKLYIGLKRFDKQAYERFCQLYPIVAAGTEFNPLTNMDVVKLYLAVVNALCEQTKYCGLNIVFDEFSKFLEANIDNAKMLNFKIIQDMAEAAVRSGNHQLHLTCITHKEILDYSTSDSFKTVEGRFHKIYNVAPTEQSYELIANAIPKTNGFNNWKKDYQKTFSELISSASVVDVFGELSANAFEKKVVEGCFPLTPLSVFSLLHVSELVGQNERTLFTFLAKNEKFSLPEFINVERVDAEFITVDYIYDYFQDLLKKEVFNTSIHSVWKKTDTALRQTKDIPQQRILKAIAIINIIKDERLKTIPSHIKVALMMDDKEFDDAINYLNKIHVLSQRDSSEFVLLTANGVDVQKKVENFVNSKVANINICDLLNTHFPQGYVLPREYNDRFGMLRYYKTVFMDRRTIMAYQNGHQMLQDYSFDGLIVLVVDTNDVKNIEEVSNHMREFSETPEIIMCVSSFHDDIETNLKKYVAIKQMMVSDLADDPHYLEEMQIYEEDIHRQIQDYIEKKFSPASNYSQYLNAEGMLNISRHRDLNQEVSRICLERYSKTPVINNEMVNKKRLNSQNLKGRNLAVEWVLKHTEDDVIPCMDGYGPEVSVFKAMYVHTGLYANRVVSDTGINEVLDIIRQFIDNCAENECSVSDLYNILKSPPYGIREGIIPLFFAYVLREYKDNVFLYFKGKEIELNVASLSSLNDNPQNYSLLLEKGTVEREWFLTCLEAVFDSYADPSYIGTNRIIAIVKSMQNWMRSLPEYTKKFSMYYINGNEVFVDNSTKVIRNDLLRFEINYRELLFENWRSKLSTSNELGECLEEIKRVKQLLDSHVANYKNNLINYLVALFVPGYSGSLANAIKMWSDKIPSSTKQHVFDSESNKLMLLAEQLKTYDDLKILDDLAVLFVAMRIEDWSDQLAVQFSDQISNAIERINTFKEHTEDTEECRLEIQRPGLHVDKTFTASDITPLGKTALSNLREVFDEYNDAIETDEKLAILAQLISDVIH